MVDGSGTMTLPPTFTVVVDCVLLTTAKLADAVWPPLRVTEKGMFA
jgi:hypothetical protein